MICRLGSGLVLVATIALAPAPIFAAQAPAAQSQTIKDEAIKRVDRMAARLLAEDRFSGIVLVAQHGRVIFEQTYGLADREHGGKIRPDTAFHIGSANKMWTATAILQLVAADRISLDDRFGKVLTNYPNREVAEKVSVRHLLTHSGGTGDAEVLSDPDSAKRGRMRELSDYVALYGNRGLEFEPGTKQRYSNYGYILLGLIVERLSGMSYRDYIAKFIFAPSGMTHSGFPTRDDPPAWVALGYAQMWPGQDKPGPLRRNTESLPFRGSSAGGAVASASDMVRFIEALRSGKLIPLELLAEATRPNAYGSGFGIWNGGKREQAWWGHGGGSYGMSADARYYPSPGLTVIMLANRDPNVSNQIADFFGYVLRDPEGAVPLFLRGSMNGWSASTPLNKLEDDRYTVDVSLDAGDHEFKLASEDWETVALGTAPDGPKIEDQVTDFPLEAGPNAAMRVRKRGVYRSR